MKTERFEMRLDPHTVQRIDAWRAEQPDRPSRAEAMRRLADTGLAVLGKGSIRINHGETLILMMLRDLYKHQNVEGEIQPDFVGEAIWGGHYWGLEWQYSGLFHGHVDREEVVYEVVDVLDMWSFIETGFARLSDKEKKKLRRKSGRWDNMSSFPVSTVTTRSSISVLHGSSLIILIGFRLSRTEI